MFGLGFSEILLILVVAIIFLGPDKLPEVAVNIAKFLKSFKSTVSDAKESLNKEIKIEELKKETGLDAITEIKKDFSDLKEATDIKAQIQNQFESGIEREVVNFKSFKS